MVSITSGPGKVGHLVAGNTPAAAVPEGHCMQCKDWAQPAARQVVPLHSYHGTAAAPGAAHRVGNSAAEAAHKRLAAAIAAVGVADADHTAHIHSVVQQQLGRQSSYTQGLAGQVEQQQRVGFA